MNKFRKIKEIVVGVLTILFLLLMGASFVTDVFNGYQRAVIQTELIYTIEQQDEINDKLIEVLEWLEDDN